MTTIERMQEGRRKAAELRRREAVAVVAAHRTYEKDAASVFLVGRQAGFASEEHMKAKQALRRRWPVLPGLPTKAQMALVYGDLITE